MELMSIDPLVELKFSEEFKNKLRDLSKKYRNIRADLQPILDDLQAGNNTIPSWRILRNRGEFSVSNRDRGKQRRETSKLCSRQNWAMK
jgi:mRNA-degrading endonuclease RelE of RelBE toxin-antitoxin system